MGMELPPKFRPLQIVSLIRTRPVQPVATCRQASYCQAAVTYLQFPTQVCFPTKETPTSVSQPIPKNTYLRARFVLCYETRKYVYNYSNGYIAIDHGTSEAAIYST